MIMIWSVFIIWSALLLIGCYREKHKDAPHADFDLPSLIHGAILQTTN